MTKQDQDKIIEHTMTNIDTGHRIFLRAIAKDLQLNDHSQKDLLHIAEKITFNRRYMFDIDNDFGIYVVVDKDYKEPTEVEKETERLSFKKLKYETQIAERTYKTFWVAFWLSVAAFIMSLIALIKTW
jgi:hypothetical protein